MQTHNITQVARNTNYADICTATLKKTGLSKNVTTTLRMNPTSLLPFVCAQHADSIAVSCTLLYYSLARAYLAHAYNTHAKTLQAFTKTVAICYTQRATIVRTRRTFIHPPTPPKMTKPMSAHFCKCIYTSEYEYVATDVWTHLHMYI